MVIDNYGARAQVPGGRGLGWEQPFLGVVLDRIQPAPSASRHETLPVLRLLLEALSHSLRAVRIRAQELTLEPLNLFCPLFT